MNWKSIDSNEDFWVNEEIRCDYDDEVDENCSDEKSSTHDSTNLHDFSSKMASSSMKNKGCVYLGNKHCGVLKRMNSNLSSSNKMINMIKSDELKCKYFKTFCYINTIFELSNKLWPFSLGLIKSKSKNEEILCSHHEKKQIKYSNSSNLACEIKSLLGLLAEQRKRADSICKSKREGDNKGSTQTKGYFNNHYLNLNCDQKLFEELWFVTVNDIEEW